MAGIRSYAETVGFSYSGFESASSRRGNLDAHDRMSDEQLLSEIVNLIIALPPMLRQRVQSDLHSLVGSNVVAMRTK